MLHDRKSRFAQNDGMISASAPDGEPLAYAQLTGAARVGADLRAARERLGWHLVDLARGLRIRLDYLEALEAGRLGMLPGSAYAMGFLRTYAGALGLDAAELVRRLKAEAADVGRKPMLSFPAPVPERGVPTGALVLLGVVLAVVAYAGWYRLSGDGRLPAEVVPPVPARLAPLEAQIVPPVAKPPPAANAAPVMPAPSVVAQDSAPAGPSVSPSSAAAAQPMPAPVVDPNAPRIVLRATNDAWMQVRDAGGQVLLNRVLHAGDSWPVPPRPDLLLTTGNAGGTQLVVDGAVASGIGGSGAVRRDMPLDADTIKDGKLPAQMQASAAPQPAAAPAVSQPAPFAAPR